MGVTPGTNVDANMQLNTNTHIANIEATGPPHVTFPVISPNEAASPDVSASLLSDYANQSNLNVDVPGSTCQAGVIVGHVSGETSIPPSIMKGQLVFAEYAGGWYYANVLKVNNGSCDVAWL